MPTRSDTRYRCLAFWVAIWRPPDRQAAEFQFPHRQNAQAVVAEHADIKFASLDVLLGDGGGLDLLVNEGDGSASFSSVSTMEDWRDPERSILAQALDDQRQGKARAAL